MRLTLTPLRDLWRCESGSALVEMTIILPLAVALMVGVVDFGVGLSTQATANKAVREAARYLSSLPSAACTQGWAQTNAKNLAVYGNTAGTGSPLISGWSTGSVTATCTPCSTTASCGFDQATGPQYVATVIATVSFIPWMYSGTVPVTHTLTLSAQHEERVVGN
jgi:Flp pilus assembly protein TadG